MSLVEGLCPTTTRAHHTTGGEPAKMTPKLGRGHGVMEPSDSELPFTKWIEGKIRNRETTNILWILFDLEIY